MIKEALYGAVFLLVRVIIALRYRLKVPKDKRATVERALEHHEGLCAASESVRRGITVEWQSEIEEESESDSGQPAAATTSHGKD